MSSMQIHSRQRQAHKLSPRLQHAVRLLQMSSLDFAAMVRDSLGSNPFLEPGPEEDSDNDIVQSVSSMPQDGAADSQPPLGDGEGQGIDGDDRDVWLAEAQRGGGPGEADGAEQASVLDSVAVQATLAQHLHGQLNLLPLQPRDLVLAHALVDSLDDDGYLRSPLEELADTAELQPSAMPQELQIALRHVQALDPAGVAARDVAECLRLQLSAIGCEELRALARRIVDQHITLLAAHDTTRLASALDAPATRVAAACEAIRHLDPHPGWRFGSSPAPYVVPDVIVRRVRGEWQVQLNPAVVPRVQLNLVYAALFKRHRSADNDALALHLQEARWTLRNVEQRFSTILDVARAIVSRQRHFFEFGSMAMKPLGLREIAEEVGVHESTVSRVTSNKFLASPLGVFELKHFFSRAMVSANGSACSGTAIRGLVEQIIQAEHVSAPLSDVAIAEQLAQQGLTVARRTVTKYRQMLHIDAVDTRRRRYSPAAQ
ncbi:MAG: RNA polymerase factor sigma-54 [Rubrivivax sp.]